MTNRTKLSERERRFVEAYMGRAAGIGSKAAILAGYSEKTARQQASHLLTKPNILAAIEERTKSDPKVATREQRQQFWTEVYSGEGKFGKARLSDRLKASELLGKSQADFIERTSTFNLDAETLRSLSEEQLAQIAAGRDPLEVLAGAPSRG